MITSSYLMEGPEEAMRLDVKTDAKAVIRQAQWAGIQPGMRVADICCGSGKTTSIFHELVQPKGSVAGVDGSLQRLAFASERYGAPGIEFVCRDITKPLNDLGHFDFVWLRFVLEYFGSNAFDLVQSIAEIVRPSGILCLLDLDHNSLNHYPAPARLEQTMQDLTQLAVEKANFDPYAGRKLYSHLYRLGYEDIAVDVSAHHLIIGELKEADAFNWLRKVSVAAKNLGYGFGRYAGGYEEFLKEYETFFSDPGRFTYTPLVSCRGRSPASSGG
ncbi:MAG TPA: methyltransferase domain-containing protein [Dissulfurispiraceae bacterium]|nr:methyltransferase domain-containing protein [Dissulfurispiraceae bacterium]